MGDGRLSVLHAHYVDTFAHITAHLKTRDRLFMFLLVVVGIMLFQIAAPDDFGTAATALIAERVGLKNGIDVHFIGSLVWFVLLALLIRYYQTVVHIERQYEYIHGLEAAKPAV